MKHKHADLIREWALDTSKVMQYRRTSSDDWVDCINQPTWAEKHHYRFKPDYYVFATVLNNSLQVSFVGKPNIKLTFDGETQELKAAEVLK